MNVAIVGSRAFPEPGYIVSECLSLCRRESDVILTGGAAGVDTEAERLARMRHFSVKVFKADWSEYGKSAGPRRNAEMIAAADRVFALWDGESRGTRNAIDLALKLRKRLDVRFPAPHFLEATKGTR